MDRENGILNVTHFIEYIQNIKSNRYFIINRDVRDSNENEENCRNIQMTENCKQSLNEIRDIKKGAESVK